MRLFPSVVILVACATSSSPLVGQSPPPTLPLTVPSVMVAGETVDLVVDAGLLPGERVFFARGSRIGAGPCLPIAGGYCTEIRNPELIDTARADAAGVATLSITVPASVPDGLTVPFQALVVRGVNGTDSAWSPPVTTVTDVLQEGCTDPTAANYDDMADLDDGTCIDWSCTNGVCIEIRTQAESQDLDVDVLLVVDRSGSMSEEQQWLQDSATEIVDLLDNRGGDWKLGVITPDMDDVTQQGRLQAVIERGPSALADFTAAMTPDTSGSADEKHFAAIRSALNIPLSNNENAGFRRDDALLVVGTVSDEDDVSNLGPTGLVSFLEGLPAPEPPTYSAMTNDRAAGCDFFSNVGAPRHHDVIDATGGHYESICTDETVAFFESMLPITNLVTRRFELQCAPANLAITVTVDGSIVPYSAVDGWTYDAVTPRVEFHGNAVPEPGAEIVFEYDESSDCMP